MVRVTLKRRTFGRKRQAKEESENGMRSRGLRQQPRSKREFNKALRKTLGMELGKREAGISSGLQTIKEWTLWRCQPPPKRKKNLLAMLA
jgi:hypothetical protein